MTSTNKLANALKTLLNLGRDPQCWISMLAVLTVLGVSSGALETADHPADAAMQYRQTAGQAPSQPVAGPDEQVASLDTSKL
ncbi:hypothetical protein LNV08_03500 [Paucibacter sp. TC2R-5]|uniref:hypothetical protein n=1 Tax=Paucibacter sp. TC2R-5 TaxID=2893555 RepID=UPI0021E4CB37|nr:hypothetical protein [Paucibacter sp. TC2R-5]MCV2358029.1 hypothetical protein [Paucibacter sp. TC2R-5]